MVTGGAAIGILQAHCAGRFLPEGEEVLSLLASIAAIAIQNIQGALNLRQEAALLEQTHEMMLDGWIRILSLRDSETEEHTRRVCDITLKIAHAIGCSEKDLVHLRRGALLHDIGKIGVPDSILHKTGPLNDEEWKIMRQHPVYAFQLLSAIPNLRPTVDIPYCHHEKWDGNGYPRGLKGEDIPLSARIFSVADVWDALTSYRPYRPAWSEEKALAYMVEEAGKSFDPRVVKVFLRSVLGLDSSLVNSIPSAKTAPLSFYCQFPPAAQSKPVSVV
jgi:putative nucleotidyltransferase with HDIG domain